MPVRKIPYQTRSVRARIPKPDSLRSAETESLLELDFTTLLRFNSEVHDFEEQPFEIPYFFEGKWRRYTPDFYVTFKPDPNGQPLAPPWVCEIKYREDLEKNQAEYQPKFEAATLYANERGAEFRIFDENDIRTPYFYNAQFLLPRLRREPPESETKLVLDQLHELRGVSVEGLKVSIYRDPWMQAKILPVIWYLVGTRQIGIDLDQPITNASQVWFIEPEAAQ